MQACGANPGAFKRKPEDEAEHRRQQADAEARAARWEKQKDDEAMARMLGRKGEEKLNFPLDVGDTHRLL